MTLPTPGPNDVWGQQLNDHITSLENTTATLDEMTNSFNIAVVVSADISFPVMGPLHFPISIEQFSICQWNTTTIAASDSNYWTIELRRVRNNVTTVIATKTTRVTASTGVPAEAWPGRGNWDFNNATFDAANKLLLAGDIVSVAFLKTGAPSSTGYMSGTIRYVPTS